MTVVILSGGTGGAKLARGMLDVAGDELTVIANTGDDVEIHGGYVSPDPDLTLFWLADRIDARGWGIEGDTFHAMERLRARGEEVWFNLGDEDLEICRDRARRLGAGERLTEALDALRRTLGVGARVLPMCDEPVRTWVDGTPFQEWMIRAGGKAGDRPVGPLEFRGVEQATITPEVADALANARVIIIGPSNPVISIAPILAVPGMRAAMLAGEAPVVAVSPFVQGTVVKGPTAAFAPDLAAALAHYDGLLDGVVADERVPALPVLETDVLMDGAAGRARLAEETLRFATALA
ncbi:MAG: 2-phospho-L-lactate transferase [Solirubrobacteraceae bacterium]|nr:2-phospho-L-lactate transferase [Solirubrobacteraceae bacterium]